MPDIFHAIRLKENGNLRKLASHIDEQLAEITKDDMVSYAVYYGEFQYQTAMLSTSPKALIFQGYRALFFVKISVFFLKRLDKSLQK